MKMKKYIITVNSVSYEVEVEEVGAAADVTTATTIPTAPAVQAAPASPAAPKVAPKAAAQANGTKVNAPLPGTILKIPVTNGQAIKAGDILCILEAMKMENEILAPVDGKVTIQTSQGATVNNGDLLFVIA